MFCQLYRFICLNSTKTQYVCAAIDMNGISWNIKTWNLIVKHVGMRLTGSHPSWSSLLHLGFFLVHSYERVGLYQVSTVNHCRLARTQKYHYAKVTTKIAIVPLVFLLIFFCETESETMDVVRHRLCRRRWPSGARSSATRLVATSLAMPGALFWTRNLSEGGRYA